MVLSGFWWDSFTLLIIRTFKTVFLIRNYGLKSTMSSTSSVYYTKDPFLYRPSAGMDSGIWIHEGKVVSSVSVLCSLKDYISLLWLPLCFVFLKPNQVSAYFHVCFYIHLHMWPDKIEVYFFLEVIANFAQLLRKQKKKERASCISKFLELIHWSEKDLFPFYPHPLKLLDGNMVESCFWNRCPNIC